uniref:Major facilitator superfamily (MFS) profile domain-containing protein n=1 Tax=Lepisosteus oculatus TaxID=7918 RepID=W5MNH4_LEPOC
MVNRFGRRNSMLLVNVVCLVGGLLMGLSTAAASFEMLIAGRLLIGVFCGLCTGLVPMYIGEISPTGLRGAFGTLHQLGVVLGILVAQVLGLGILGAQAGGEGWETQFLQAARPADRGTSWSRFREGTGLQLPSEDKALLPFSEDRVGTGSAVKPGGRDSPQGLDGSAGSRGSAPRGGGALPDVSVLIPCFSQVFYYSTGEFAKAGITEPIYATIGAGVVNTIFTVISLFLVERAGRRTLHLVGLAGMAASALLMTLGLVLAVGGALVCARGVGEGLPAEAGGERSEGGGPDRGPHGLGPRERGGPEIPPSASQGKRRAVVCHAVSAGAKMAASRLCIFFFFLPQRLCNAYVYIIFMVFLIIFFIFTFFRVPETKGRTFEDISKGFAAGPPAGAGSPLEQAPEGVIIPPTSPTEKVPMVDLSSKDTANGPS